MLVRSYKVEDYEAVVKLYMQSELYGGQFDENRDSKERLQKRIELDPESILVALVNGIIVGSISIIEDGRVALLFRFAVKANNIKISTELFQYAKKILRKKGYNQILLYTPVGNSHLNKRYEKLGFTKGNDYTWYWRNI